MSETDGAVQQGTQCTAATDLFLRRTNSGLIRFVLAGGLGRAGTLMTAPVPIPSDLLLGFPSLSFLSTHISSLLLRQALVMLSKLSLNSQQLSSLRLPSPGITGKGCDYPLYLPVIANIP